MTQAEKIERVAQMVGRMKEAGVRKAYAFFKDERGRSLNIIYEDGEFFLYDIGKKKWCRPMPVLVHHVITNLQNGTYPMIGQAQFYHPFFKRGEVV